MKYHFIVESAGAQAFDSPTFDSPDDAFAAARQIIMDYWGWKKHEITRFRSEKQSDWMINCIPDDYDDRPRCLGWIRKGEAP